MSVEWGLGSLVWRRSQQIPYQWSFCKKRCPAMCVGLAFQVLVKQDTQTLRRMFFVKIPLSPNWIQIAGNSVLSEPQEP